MLEIGKTYRIIKEITEPSITLFSITKQDGVYIFSEGEGREIPRPYFRVSITETSELISNGKRSSCWVGDAYDARFPQNTTKACFYSDKFLTEYRGEPIDADEHEGELWIPYADGGKGAWRFL
jgi:hypothetical protein